MKFWYNVGDPRAFQSHCRLSVSSFVQNIFAIKSGNRRKTEQMYKVFGLQFFGRDDSNFSTADC